MLNWPKYLLCATLAALASGSLSAHPAGGDAKLTAEEVVTRHLDAIAPAAVRAAVKSRGATGSTVFQIWEGGGHGQAPGSAVLISAGRKMAFLMRLPSTGYPGEHFVTDDEKAFVAPIQASTRSALGSFIFHHDQILKEGLFGGVLSSAWPLYDLGSRHAKLRYEGLRKIDGRQLHEIDYTPRRANTNVEISLYFDPETFRHVKTVYRYTMEPNMGSSPTETPSQRVSHWVMQEDFSDFRTVEGYTLPMHWMIRLSVDADRSVSVSYDVAFARTDTNPPLNERDLVVP